MICTWLDIISIKYTPDYSQKTNFLYILAGINEYTKYNSYQQW